MPRTAPKKQRPANRDPSQLGIFAIPDLDVEGDDDDIGLDDDDLEAELSAILASGPTKPKAKRPPPKPTAAAVNLDAMVAESLRDLPSDDDSSADEDDPSLLAELSAVTGDGEVKDDKPLETMQPMTNSEMDTLKLLHERIAMYMQAEENSKAVGDTLKVRRLGRGLKTMNELVKKAEAGVIIDEADIPMPVSIIAKKPHEDDQTDKPPEIFAPLDMDTGLPAPLLPQRTAPTPPVPPPRASPEKSVPLAAAAMPSPPSSVVPIDDSVLKILIERRDQYKRAAVSAKRDGNTGEALGFVKIAKKFDSVIEEASKGRPVDLSTMPPPPPGFELPAASYEPPALPQVQEEADPPVPATVMEALEQRLAKFQQQEENAKAEGNSSKARRMGRIVNQYRDAIKLHRAGKPIPVDELPTPPGFAPIPVPASANPALPSSTTHIPGPGTLEPTSPSSSSVTPRPSPQPSLQVIGTSKQEKLALLLQKQNQLKGAALKAKEDGDLPLAKENLRQYRNLEQLLEAMKNEIPDELISQFDSAVEDAIAGRPINISALVSASQTQTTTLPTPNEVSSKANEVVPPISDTVEDPPIPATVMEALEQRLAKFQQQEENAKAEGNSSKARRMGRIVNQYRDAIKLHRAGKPIPVDELPTPPGFAPIPVPGASDNPALPSSTTHIPGPGKLEPTSPSFGSVTPQRSPQPSLKGVGGTKQDKQLTVLLLKQKQFKEAALKAKQDGDLLLAKEFLRQYKSFDPLIEATQSGFPVDLTTLPAPPGSSQSIEKEFEVVKMVDCIPGTTSELYNQLITDLQQQLKLCMETRAHFKAIGDVGSANKFEHLAISSKKDLDTVKIACNKDEPVPKFHYERRTFNIVRCNTDLTDNEMEISIVQGVNYNVPNPKEIDTYVRFEFPAPSNEEPKRDKTSTVYNTNNPAYDAKFIIAIPRSNRNFQRLFKRHALKLEVWAKGCVLSSVCKFCKCCSLDRLPRGFLRSDSLVGTVSVKLLPLETKCTIHDSFDVMDGRKPLGGKLEVKIRIRHPVQSKQVEQLQEKWLVVD